jgi:signal peptidase I
VVTTSKPPVRPGSTVREVVETGVFVVVLVLILRLFLVEFFQIPTGSMATTLLGNHIWATCPQCGFVFPVSCSSEQEQPRTREDPVAACICPNCRYLVDLFRQGSTPHCDSGDRVAVAKFLYDTHLRTPERQEVVVFKYPEEPNQKYETVNYIKRLVGKPGETIGIYYGDLYVYPPPDNPDAEPISYRDAPSPSKPEDARNLAFMYKNDRQAMSLFKQGKFEIIRKGPAQVLAMRRIVYDNDHPAQDLVRFGFPPRWAPEKDVPRPETPDDYRELRKAAEQEGAWLPDGAGVFRHPAREGRLDWLRYRHLLAPRTPDMRAVDLFPESTKPELITDFLGYNTWQPLRGAHALPTPNWVGDLIIDCEAAIERSEGELVLELAKGVDRFQARWNLTSGECALWRLTEDKQEELDHQPTGLRGPGTYSLRFANVDERLMVWVNRNMPFAAGVSYASPRQHGPFENDLQPAGIGVRGGGVRVSKLKLWRDTYYTLQPGSADAPTLIPDWSDPGKWAPLRDLPAETLYVQPGHYLCLGDNSPESADSRSWGLVPRQLLQGRALFVYFPLLPRIIE